LNNDHKLSDQDNIDTCVCVD